MTAWLLSPKAFKKSFSAARQLVARRIFGDVFIKKSNGHPFRLASRAIIQNCEGLLRFHLLRMPASATYPCYRPDSDFVFQLHPEVKSLTRSWLSKNERNNAGDLARFYALILNIKQVIADKTEGDFAELGVYRGNSAAILAHFARRSGRLVLLFDTFTGFGPKDLHGDDANRKVAFTTTSLEGVRRLAGEDPCMW